MMLFIHLGFEIVTRTRQIRKEWSTSEYVEILERTYKMLYSALGLNHPRTMKKWHTKPTKPPPATFASHPNFVQGERRLNCPDICNGISTRLGKITRRKRFIDLRLPLKQRRIVSFLTRLHYNDMTSSKQLSPIDENDINSGSPTSSSNGNRFRVIWPNAVLPKLKTKVNYNWQGFLMNFKEHIQFIYKEG